MASTQLKIFAFLVKECGFTRAGAASVMGAWQCESGNEPKRCEGDYLASFPGYAKVTSNIPNSFDSFCVNILFPAYAKTKLRIKKSAYNYQGKYWPGIGLAQWTGQRTYNLYHHAKSMGENIYSLTAQLSYFKKELKSAYKSTYNHMKTVKDTTEGVSFFCINFEGGSPTPDRIAAAKRIYNKYKNTNLSNVKVSTKGSSRDTKSKVWPVDKKYKVSVKYSAAHDGVSIQCPENTAVRVWRGGSITEISNKKGKLGGYISVKHSDKLVSFYGHLKADSSEYKKGDHVNAGDTIALSGSTGDCKSAQLHFGMHKNGKSVDPQNYVVPGNNKIYKDSSEDADSLEGKHVKNPEDVIDANKIKSRIVIIDKDARGKDIPFNKITSIGTVGIMLYAGAYYTQSHSVAKSYRGTYLNEQATAATQKGMKWGLYHIVRAKTVDEAKYECQQLYYTTANYPPAYGVWLKLDLTADVKTNNEILAYYYTQLSRWGFKKSCGIYCDDKQLKKITWSDFQDSYLLMYINPISSGNYSSIYKILDPTFFQVKG